MVFLPYFKIPRSSTNGTQNFARCWQVSHNCKEWNETWWKMALETTKAPYHSSRISWHLVYNWLNRTWTFTRIRTQNNLEGQTRCRDWDRDAEDVERHGMEMSHIYNILYIWLLYASAPNWKKYMYEQHLDASIQSWGPLGHFCIPSVNCILLVCQCEATSKKDINCAIKADSK